MWINSICQSEIDRGALLSDEEVAGLTDYKRYQVTDSGISPRALPMQSRALVVTDSDEHDETGHLTESAEIQDPAGSQETSQIYWVKKEISPPVSTRCPGRN